MIDVREDEDTGSASNAQEQKKGRQNVMILFKEFHNFILKKTNTDFGEKINIWK